MYKYKSWNDENKKFGSASNEIGSSWDEANKIAKSEIENQERRTEEKRTATATRGIAKASRNTEAERLG